MLAGLGAELVDLGARGVRLEQRVVDEAGDLAWIDAVARAQAETLGALAEHAAQPVRAAVRRRRVAGARRFLGLQTLQDRPDDGLDQVVIQARHVTVELGGAASHPLEPPLAPRE